MTEKTLVGSGIFPLLDVFDFLFVMEKGSNIYFGVYLIVFYDVGLEED